MNTLGNDTRYIGFLSGHENLNGKHLQVSNRISSEGDSVWECHERSTFKNIEVAQAVGEAIDKFFAQNPHRI